MIYFYVGEYQNKRVELSGSSGYASIGVHYDGRPVGALDKEQTRQLVQWLINHDRLDLDELLHYKRTFDESECRCNKVAPFNVSKPSCPKHFEVG